VFATLLFVVVLALAWYNVGTIWAREVEKETSHGRMTWQTISQSSRQRPVGLIELLDLIPQCA
jgi:hypothetical protein